MSSNDREVELTNLLDSIRDQIRRSGHCDTVSLSRSLPELASEALGLIEIERELEAAAMDWKGRDNTDTIDAEETGLLPSTKESNIKSPHAIGRYQILRQLGQGGMGTVYAAEDPELRRQVALKIPHFSGPPEKLAATRARFLREARAAARVEHPNVCPIYDVGEHDDQPFVVMAFVEGESLADRLGREGRFDDPRAAVELIARVAEALGAVHAHGITHRDLKPANILIRKRDGQAVLTDFGLAQIELDGEHLTNEGAMVGTPAYMSPEQADSALGPVGPRSDIFSLGIVLFQMLTGRRPFEGTTSQILGQLSSKPVPHVSMLRMDLDPALDNLVARATAQEQENRFANAAAFAAALRAWLTATTHRSPETTSPYITGPVMSARRRNWPFVIVLATLGALAVLVPAGYLGVHLIQHRKQLTSVPAQPGSDRSFVPANPVPLKGFIDVRVRRAGFWNESDVPLYQRGVLPLKPGDLLWIDIELNRPAYIYVLWLDTEGVVTPLYPWTGNDWQQRPKQEEMRSSLHMPSKAGQVLELQGGPPGIESMILLTREEVLPPEFAWDEIFTGLPKQNGLELGSAVWLENGQIVHDEANRKAINLDIDRAAPKLRQVQGNDDPVLRSQAILQQKLAKWFSYTRAVCFSNRGDQK
ncbi:MAG TPA: protein kinase [Gemmataceae bacterium]|nr:protein kinase [Gemmataceae bacterium]